MSTPKYQIEQLEEWTERKVGNVLFDSDIDNWNRNTSIQKDQDINQSLLLPQTTESSPIPDLNGIPTSDNTKDYLKMSVEYAKAQLNKCQLVCQNLENDSQIAQNMKMITEQLNYIHMSLNVIVTNIENSLP
ncbi:hypothetical protein KM1_094550 [Entamoeba histolytica HM-3:IMSS]|uniref:Uncharacterized protein n=1 Tax=Entamoeba histolytica HM-3:IMSS TaxID=885315 RepID=M7W0Y1_ENTHI|nr:hypothetical protein KM1_094550 [Entamoeba histolytica HM-3:IMSS]